LNQEGTVAQEYDGWVEFARSMVPMMMPAGRFIAELVGKLKPGPIQVLDVAAGHGMFGILVAQANPEARIVALDWANVLEVAVHNAAAAGVQDRYGLLPGSAMSVEFGDGFDVVLMTNFLHHFDRATCELVMHKIRACLKEDGCVITLEFVPNEDRVSPPVPATFSFTMLGSTPAGDAYTFAEYDAMWKAAGFSSSEMQDVPNSPQRVIVTRR
jgi:ubiquinone/menaquinone biosynthesis C-methylase UbiE